MIYCLIIYDSLGLKLSYTSETQSPPR